MNIYKLVWTETGTFSLILISFGCNVGEPEKLYSDDVPQFKFNAAWPKMLPDNWILGQVSGLAIDSKDNIWIIHRQGSLTPEEMGASLDPPISRCCIPAPPVIQITPEGTVMQAWGGPGEDYEWG